MKVFILFIAVFLVSCATTKTSVSDPIATVNENLGQFTAASSYNVRGLKYDTDNQTKIRTVGEACYEIGTTQHEGMLQEAMDNAIKNGQDKGIDGDLLVNVRMKHQIRHKEKTTETKKVFSDPKILKEIIDEEECWIVSGDLVRIVESTD